MSIPVTGDQWLAAATVAAIMFIRFVLMLIEIEVLVGPSILVGKAQLKTAPVRHRRGLWHPQSELA